ncbi:MAG: carboxypeptidase-like regulatory domain-containing protein, partial [Bacteroidota bacterium]
MKRNSLVLLFLVTFCAVLLITCVEDDTPTEPGAGSTTLSGTLRFPANSGITMDDVVVNFGGIEARPASDGSFEVSGMNGVPTMAIAYDRDAIPVLMAFVRDPEYHGSLTLNAQTTALGLSFLAPFICSSDPDAVGEILYILNRLPELDQLEQLLEQKLSANPRALAQEDAEISSALSDVAVAFLNEIPTPMLPEAAQAPSETADEIVIDPGNIVSGHQVISIGGPDFDISNWYGRWAYCITPSEEFFLQPNGSLADILKLSQPWAPSSRRFQLVVETNQPAKEINVYGLGWDDDPTNLWSSLSEAKQTHAMNAGVATVAFELVPHTICVLTGASGTIGRGTIAKAEVAKVVGRVFSSSANLYKIKVFIQEKNYWGLAWHVSKVLLEEIVQNEEFRNSFLKLFGISLAEGKLKSLAAAVNFGARVFFAGDALTSFAKTWVGVFLSRFETTFRISREQIDFGKIDGSVHDGESGLPIQGATVIVRGDDGNPLNPPHTFTTLDDGSFYFENIMTGNKTLEASKEDYGPKSVPVTVEKNKTTSVLISLSKSKGKITGSVINEILQKKGVFPSTFQGEY